MHINVNPEIENMYYFFYVALLLKNIMQFVLKIFNQFGTLSN